MENIVVYNEGELEINVSVDKETIWLSQKQIAELFEVTIPNINMHIKAIYKDEELSENRTIQKSLIVRLGSNSPSSNMFFRCMLILGTVV